eukprot:134873_1
MARTHDTEYISTAAGTEKSNKSIKVATDPSTQVEGSERTNSPTKASSSTTASQSVVTEATVASFRAANGHHPVAPAMQIPALTLTLKIGQQVVPQSVPISVDLSTPAIVGKLNQPSDPQLSTFVFPTHHTGAFTASTPTVNPNGTLNFAPPTQHHPQNMISTVPAQMQMQPGGIAYQPNGIPQTGGIPGMFPNSSANFPGTSLTGALLSNFSFATQLPGAFSVGGSVPTGIVISPSSGGPIDMASVAAMQTVGPTGEMIPPFQNIQPEGEAVLIRNAADKQYHCHLCRKKFRVKDTFEAHLRRHTGKAPFKCTQCGRCFKHRITLKDHEANHTGHKPYTCNICGKRFARRYPMQVHMNSHSETRLWQCEFCGTGFRYKHILKKHMLSELMKIKQNGSADFDEGLYKIVQQEVEEILAKKTSELRAMAQAEDDERVNGVQVANPRPRLADFAMPRARRRASEGKRGGGAGGAKRVKRQQYSYQPFMTPTGFVVPNGAMLPYGVPGYGPQVSGYGPPPSGYGPPGGAVQATLPAGYGPPAHQVVQAQQMGPASQPMAGSEIVEAVTGGMSQPGAFQPMTTPGAIPSWDYVPPPPGWAGVIPPPAPVPGVSPEVTGGLASVHPVGPQSMGEFGGGATIHVGPLGASSAVSMKPSDILKTEQDDGSTSMSKVLHDMFAQNGVANEPVPATVLSNLGPSSHRAPPPPPPSGIVTNGVSSANSDSTQTMMVGVLTDGTVACEKDSNTDMMISNGESIIMSSGS